MLVEHGKQIKTADLLTDSVIEESHERLKHAFGDIFEIYNDPKLMEMMFNSDGKLFYQNIGEPTVEHPKKFQYARVERIIKIAAHISGITLSYQNPILETTLPFDGARFSATIPPITKLPTFSIRKKAIRIFSLEDYLNDGIISHKQHEIIQEAVRGHKNIMVAGSTGSGKTTFCNAIIQEISDQFPNERVIMIQDVAELQCASNNFVDFISDQYTTPTHLVKLCLRYKPTRILMGEIRDAVALDLLDLWNTGHEGGLSTVHANSALLTLTRLENLIERNPFAPKRIPEVIADTLDYIFYIEENQETKRRSLTEILKIEGYDRKTQDYKLKKL